MASTYSNLKIELITTGEQSGTWGNTTNTNLGTAIEEAIIGSADVTFASADVTITLTNTNATQVGRHLRLKLVGTTGGSARNLILGSGCQFNKPYLVYNTCNDAITVKNTTGTGISVPAGKSMWLYNDGTNVVNAVDYASTFSAGSMTLGSALPVASGGTGQTTASGAINALLPNQTSNSGKYLTTNGSAASWDYPVISFRGGTTGLTPSTASVGDIVLGGTLNIANGGTGQTTATAAINALVPSQTSNSGKFLTTDGTNLSWGSPSGGVTTFKTSLSGLTPSTDTSGAVTLAGTLGASSGGTGNTSYTDGQLLIGNTATSGLTKATITAGSGIGITNGNGSITISATGTAGVTTFSAGSTGLTPSTGTSGAVTLGGTLAVASGGTGATTAANARTNLAVPSTTGSGASGTWPIGISGNAATVTNGVYTTSFTGTNQSLATPGFQKLPGGVIIQWGTFSVSASSIAITFPTAFPTACINVQATRIFLGDTAGIDTAIAVASAPTTTGVTLSVPNPCDGYWLAIGY